PYALFSFDRTACSFSPDCAVMRRVVDVIRRTYESFGFLPLETPAVERVEHLLAKGIAEKEVYALRRLSAGDGDDGAKDLALRFDLTVPLARYVAQHHRELHFPFRRYQIQPVWRGERPQAGRYRQFIQCDIDVIGDGALSLEFDAEMPAVVFQAFRRIGIGDFSIRINNRKILGGLFKSVGLEADRDIRAAMSIVDDLEKIGIAAGVQKLGELGLSTARAEGLIAFFDQKGDNESLLKALGERPPNALFEEGVAELEAVVNASVMNVPERTGAEALIVYQSERDVFRRSLKIDLGIARGLDYYTGTVYETRLDSNASIGSVCSGGRYEDLTSAFIDARMPGVGISIGLSRLISELLREDVLKAERRTIAAVLVTIQDQTTRDLCKEVANGLRSAGIPTELYLETKKLATQLRYADRRGFPIVVIASADELRSGFVVVRNMVYGQEQKVAIPQLASAVRALTPPGMEWNQN
ncbi:histidine--tRNA ligase, partial [Azospirillum rugosum]